MQCSYSARVSGPAGEHTWIWSMLGRWCLCELKLNCTNNVKWTTSIALHDQYWTWGGGCHLRQEEERRWEWMAEEYLSASSQNIKQGHSGCKHWFAGEIQKTKANGSNKICRAAGEGGYTSLTAPKVMQRSLAGEHNNTMELKFPFLQPSFFCIFPML